MNFFKKASNLKQRILGAGLLLIVGGIFFTDISIAGKNIIATILLTLFSFGILKELFDLFFQSKTKWTYRKKIFFGLSLIIYTIALWGLHTLSKDSMLGAPIILAVIILAILTDTGAYFTGIKFGKKKLAPTISPGKTWAGFWGGLLLPTVTALIVFAHFEIKIVMVVLLSSITVQLGDLFESYIKRLNNVKDSGNIIPGHGGVLDRFDGFLFLMFWISIFFIK